MTRADLRGVDFGDMTGVDLTEAKTGRFNDSDSDSDSISSSTIIKHLSPSYKAIPREHLTNWSPYI